MKQRYLKWICLLLCMSLCIGMLSGCGGEKAEEAPTQDTAATEAPAVSGLQIADTVWMLEGIPYTFSADGTLRAEVEPGKYRMGSYQWDPAAGTGTAVIQDVNLKLMADGDALLMEGEDGFFYSMEPAQAGAQPEPPAPVLPSPEDPLDCSVTIPGTDIEIPYPSTMKVCGQDDQILQLDAVSEEDAAHNLLISWVEIGSSYDWYFRSGLAQAEKGLAEICRLWIDLAYGDKFLEEIDAWAMDGESFFAYRCYCWLSGEIYTEGSETPVRAVIEVRYYGPTGHVLILNASADASRIDNYADIASNILDAVDYGGDWSTEPIYTGGSSSGRGDYIEDDGRGDYFEDEGRGDIF